MLCLDDVDVLSLLRLEADLNDESLEEFIEIVRNHYGLTSIAYLCPSCPGRSMINPSRETTFGELWTRHYKAEGNVFAGPTIAIGARSVLPIDAGHVSPADEKVQRLFSDVEAGAGRQGLTIPVRGPTNGLWALFIATSNEDDLSWSRRRYALMRDLVHVAHYIHQRAYELHDEKTQVDLNALTAREIEALTWCAEGHRVTDIAVLMRVGAETVKACLESARYKLQALNRAHAVAKAIQAGLIGRSNSI